MGMGYCNLSLGRIEAAAEALDDAIAARRTGRRLHAGAGDEREGHAALRDGGARGRRGAGAGRATHPGAHRRPRRRRGRAELSRPDDVRPGRPREGVHALWRSARDARSRRRLPRGRSRALRDGVDGPRRIRPARGDGVVPPGRTRLRGRRQRARNRPGAARPRRGRGRRRPLGARRRDRRRGGGVPGARRRRGGAPDGSRRRRPDRGAQGFDPEGHARRARGPGEHPDGSGRSWRWPGTSLDRPDARALPHHRRRRRRRDGRGVSRDRHEARPRGGAQAAASGLCLRPRPPRPLRARGEAARLAEPPEHRAAVCLRAGRADRRVVRSSARDGAGRGRGPGTAAQARADRRRRSGRDRAPGRRGTRGRAREGHRPPRPQAREREAHARRQGQGARFRPRQGVLGRSDVGLLGGPLAVPDTRPHRHGRGHHPRHRRVHVARAGARAHGRQARGRLGLRCRAVRDAHRQAALRGRDGERRARGGPHPRAGLDGAAASRCWTHPRPAPPLPRARPEAAPARHRRRPHPARGRDRRPAE